MSEILDFAHKKINNNFGLSVDDVAKRCYDVGRFKAYGLSQTQIKSVLNAVKNEGISPAFFAAYEANEGYNPQWGWLNHTTPQGNYLNDAKSVARWLKAQSNNMNGKPAWIDYANYKDFVPASVKRKGNEDFKNMPKGSIGRAYIPGTAATTWEVYYPNGLKASYNGVQNYGAPLKQTMNTIKYWGGNINSSGGSGDGGDSGGGDSGGGSTTIKPDLSSVNDFFKKFIDDLIKKINKELKKDIYLKGLSRNLYSSKYLIIKKQLDNTYKPKPGKAFTDMLNKAKEDGSKELKNLVSKLEKDNTYKKQTGGDSGGGDSGGGGSGGDGWYWPYNTSHITITSKQGYRWGRYHHGVDIVGTGQSGGGIYAMHSGKVTISSDSVPGWEVAGSMICIQNDKDDGYGGAFIQYEEFKAGSMTVKVGDKVKGGQRIATSGVSGNSTGEHLHMSVNHAGKLKPAKEGNWKTAAKYLDLPNKPGTYKRPSSRKKPG